MQNRAEKQNMPFKTTVNWLFNDMWFYLVIGFFDWKIGVFQQTVEGFIVSLYPKDLIKILLMENFILMKLLLLSFIKVSLDY